MADGSMCTCGHPTEDHFNESCIVSECPCGMFDLDEPEYQEEDQ